MTEIGAHLVSGQIMQMEQSLAGEEDNLFLERKIDAEGNYGFTITIFQLTLPVKLAERGMPTAKSALPEPVKSPIAKEYPK